MRTKNVHSVFYAAFSYFKQGDCLVHFLKVNFIARFKGFAGRNVFIAVRFCHRNNLHDTFAFCFSGIKECLVRFNKFFSCRRSFFCLFCTFYSFHFSYSQNGAQFSCIFYRNMRTVFKQEFPSAKSPFYADTLNSGIQCSLYVNVRISYKYGFRLINTE